LIYIILYTYRYIHIIYTTAADMQGVFSETLVYDMSFREHIILLCTISTDSCDVYNIIYT